jgi:hypothetical protein
MGVVQVTVQNAAGPGQLGSAAASVQLSRSVGAATGTALVAAVLFACLALSSPEAPQVFRALVDKGPVALAGLPPARLALLQSEITSAFRAGFFMIAAFAAVGVALAWSIPARRL